MCVCKNKNSGKLFSENGLWPSRAFPRSPKKNIQGTSANNLHDIWEVCVGDICDPQISYLLQGNMSADVVIVMPLVSTPPTWLVKTRLYRPHMHIWCIV